MISRFHQLAAEEAWAISDSGFESWWRTAQEVRAKASTVDAFLSLFDDEDEPEDDQLYTVVDGEARIEVRGVIAKGLSNFERKHLGMTDINRFTAAMEDAEQDDEVESIRINFDSPGGSVSGILEAMGLIDAASKAVFAQTETMMGSAAYFLASQADEIIVTPSSIIGSVGIITTFFDARKLHDIQGVSPILIRNTGGEYKVPNAGGLPLTDKQYKERQGWVDALFSDHLDMLIAKRDISPDYLKGQTFWGKQAVEYGLADLLESKLV